MSLLANPTMILWSIVLLLGIGAAGYESGYRHARNACAAEKLTAVQRAIEQANAVAEQDNQVLAAHEQVRERIRTVFQPIRREVIRYVQTHAGSSDPVCLDADGVRIWRAANAGAGDAASAARPDYALSGTAAAGIRARIGLAGQPRRDGAPVSRVQRPAEGAGGVGQ